MELHHYTDVNGLTGIIQNKVLWATDIGFLNDSQEMHAGINQVKEICDQYGTLQTGHKDIDELFNTFYKAIPIFVRENLERRNNYIISFSKAKDNLRQWMAYCPKNAGYSIEFHSEKILMDGQSERNNKIVARLEDVSYSAEKISEILAMKDFFNITAKIRENKTLNEHEKLQSFRSERIMHRLANDLFFHSCAVKPRQFHDEQETRLIIQSGLKKDHATKFRTKSGIIIPYFEYPIDHSYIKGITVGPNINMKLARKGLDDFLEKHSINCEVYESKCSLRNF